MKILIAVMAVILSGCVATKVETEHWKMSRWAFGYDAKLPKITMDKDGKIALKGYEGDVDPEMVNALEKVVVELIKKGVIVP